VRLTLHGADAKLQFGNTADGMSISGDADEVVFRGGAEELLTVSRDDNSAVTDPRPAGELVTLTPSNVGLAPCVIQCYFRYDPATSHEQALAGVGGTAGLIPVGQDAVSLGGLGVVRHSYGSNAEATTVYVTEIGSQAAVVGWWKSNFLGAKEDGTYGLDGFAPLIDPATSYEIAFSGLTDTYADDLQAAIDAYQTASPKAYKIEIGRAVIQENGNDACVANIWSQLKTDVSSAHSAYPPLPTA